MTTRYVELEGRYNGKPAEEAFKRSAKKIEGASKQLASKTGAIVDEQTGKRLSQFNEKTEKMRQILMLSGNAAGQASAQITYYAGTLSYLVGRLGPVEWAIMAVGAALAALGATLLKESEAEKAWKKALEDHKKALEDTKKATDELRKSEEKRMLGLESDREYQEHLARGRIEAAKEQLAIQTNAIEEAKKAIDAGQLDMTAAEMMGQIKRRDILRKQVKEHEAAYDELRKSGKAFFDWQVRQAEIAELEEEAAAAAKGDKGPKGAGAGPLDPEYMLAHVDAYENALRARQDYYSRLTMLEQMGQEGVTKIYDENADRRERIARNEMLLQERKTQAMMNNISMMGQLSSLVLSNIEQSTAAQVAQILIEAGVQAAMETARGFAALAKIPPNPVSAGLHFTAAGLYAAIGIGKAASTAAGGGGGASVSARERAQGREGEREQESKEPSVMNVYIGGKYVGRAISDALEQYQDQKNPGRMRREVR